MNAKFNNPRVCIIRRGYYPDDLLVRRNAESLVAAGYSVDIICLRHLNELAFEVLGEIKVHRLPLHAHRAGIIRYLIDYLSFFALSFVKVSWLHFKHFFTVIEADSMPDFLIFTALIPRLMGCRLILYLMESMPELWAQKSNIPMTHKAIRFLKWQEKLSCEFANAVICCHDLARRALIVSKIPEDKIITILNVPDENVFKKNLYLHPPNGVFRLIQHGTITENYGIQVVIKALKLLDPNISIHYDVIGNGEYRPVLENTVRQLGLQDRVTFHGYISQERLMELLLYSDVGLVPMLFEYQSPSKLFEFVILGKPVIASDRKTFQQHFDENEISYFKTGDERDLARAVEEAIRQPKKMQERAKLASERYENYSWDKIRKRYLDLYNKTV